LSELRAAGSGTEHGAFILQTSSGTLFSSSIFTSNNSDSIEFDDWSQVLQQLAFVLGPDFFKVVGWIHVQSSSLPSGQGSSATGGAGDWGVVSSLVNSGIADPNIVTYIVDADGNLYEYTRDKEGTTTPSPVPSICLQEL
jgi:hypothetical protein